MAAAARNAALPATVECRSALQAFVPINSSLPRFQGLSPLSRPPSTTTLRKQAHPTLTYRPGASSGRCGATSNVTCSLGDLVGADLLGTDLGRWVEELEEFGALGFYAPMEGGAEGRYATVLKYKGYHVMNISARGLGDPEAYLLKTHGVRPPHLGKQPVARFYYPGEVDHRLTLLPPSYKGLVLWVGEAKVLANNELQFLALLPALRPKVKVICEMGGSRKFKWKPLKDIVGGLPLPRQSVEVVESSPVPISEALVADEVEKEKVPVAARQQQQ
eukprot:TRINITY_DN752_c0_g1_i5.p1 TRINITY_DN752_c0_g1~~TRINITY_DN752_c0_g1_i5.p1  ORF type:complete len:275 (-),score=55.42 TRINITY_DN752_c0_g1_i5:183-1007(-)